ncbi:MAG: hypothetical protein R2695_08725 [Acidimicrobiales bacterium]
MTGWCSPGEFTVISTENLTEPSSTCDDALAILGDAAPSFTVDRDEILAGRRTASSRTHEVPLADRATVRPAAA